MNKNLDNGLDNIKNPVKADSHSEIEEKKGTDTKTVKSEKLRADYADTIYE